MKQEKPKAKISWPVYPKPPKPETGGDLGIKPPYAKIGQVKSGAVEISKIK